MPSVELEPVPGVSELALKDREMAVAVDWDKTGKPTKWRLLDAGYAHLGAIMRRNAEKLLAAGVGDWTRPPSAPALPAVVATEPVAVGAEHTQEKLGAHRGAERAEEGEEDGIFERSGDQSVLGSAETDQETVREVRDLESRARESSPEPAVLRLQDRAQPAGARSLGGLTRCPHPWFNPCPICG